MKQILVQQGMYREQENSHFGVAQSHEYLNSMGFEGAGIVFIMFTVILPKNAPDECLLNT